MKKVMYWSSFILITLIVSIGFYSWHYVNQYHIDDNKMAIQSNLSEYLSRAAGSINPNVIEVVQLDDTNSYIALFQNPDSNIGYAHLVKGWNGKLKINGAGHGTNVVSYEKIKTNNGRYGIIVGKNPGLKIDHIIADLYYNDFSFTSTVNDEEKFLRYEKIPDDIEQPFPAELTFYDKNGIAFE